MKQFESATEILRIACSGVLVDHVIWCVPMVQNALYKINLECPRVEYIGSFPIEDMDYHPFINIIHEKEWLYFIPWSQDYLVMYNLLSETMEKVNVKNGQNENYGDGVKVDEQIYLFPDKWTNRITIVNEKTKEVSYQFDLLKDLKKFLHGKTDLLFLHSYVYMGRIYLPMVERSVVVEYNCHTMEYDFIWIDQIEDNGIINCMGVASKLYLLDNMGIVYVLDVETKEVKKLFEAKTGKQYPYIALQLFGNDEIWLIPCVENEIVIYNRNTQKTEIQKIEVENYKICENENSEAARNGYKFSKVFQQKDVLWLYPDGTNLLIKVDMRTREMDGFPVLLPQEKIAVLDNFIEGINSAKVDKLDVNYGQGIWRGTAT